MKFVILILLFNALLTSCQSLLSIDEESDYKNIADYGRQAKQEYNMQLIGLGGGYRKGVETFSLTFLGDQTPFLNEARALFYYLAEGFLEKINMDEKLKAKSNIDQFTIANIELKLMFPDVEGQIRFVSNGEINNRNPLQFVYFFIHNEEGKGELGYKEPYEELKNIVETQLLHQQ